MALTFTNVPLLLVIGIIHSTHVTLRLKQRLRKCEFIAFHRNKQLQKTPQGKSHGTEISFGLRNLSSRRKALFFFREFKLPFYAPFGHLILLLIEFSVPSCAFLWLTNVERLRVVVRFVSL